MDPKKKYLKRRRPVHSLLEEPSSPLLMHQIEIEKTPKKRIRVDFDDFIKEEEARIGTMSLAEIKKYREGRKRQLENIHDMMREEGITEGRRKYLKGRRMVITNLLAFTKEKIRTINVVVHNGASMNIASKFIRIAAEELPIDIFQRLFGLAAAGEEEDGLKIDRVKKFLEGDKNEERGII